MKKIEINSVQDAYETFIKWLKENSYYEDYMMDFELNYKIPLLNYLERGFRITESLHSVTYCGIQLLVFKQKKESGRDWETIRYQWREFADKTIFIDPLYH